MFNSFFKSMINKKKAFSLQPKNADRRKVTINQDDFQICMDVFSEKKNEK